MRTSKAVSGISIQPCIFLATATWRKTPSQDAFTGVALLEPLAMRKILDSAAERPWRKHCGDL